MIIENQKILKAENGFVLTNGEVFGKVVYLGKNDSEDNWQEIKEEKAEELMKLEKETEI